VMDAAVVERPIESSAYSFVRFTGGAVAPFVAGKLGEHVCGGAPMYLGAGMVALSVGALHVSRHHLRHEPEVVAEAPAAGTVPEGAVLVALDGTTASPRGGRGRRARGPLARTAGPRRARARDAPGRGGRPTWRTAVTPARSSTPPPPACAGPACPG